MIFSGSTEFAVRKRKGWTCAASWYYGLLFSYIQKHKVCPSRKGKHICSAPWSFITLSLSSNQWCHKFQGLSNISVFIISLTYALLL